MAQSFDNKDSALSNTKALRASMDLADRARTSSPDYRPPSSFQEPIRVPPPPPDPSARRRRPVRRWGGKRRLRDWAWVFLAGGMISVFAVVILGMLVLVRLPQSSQEVLPTMDISSQLPTPVDARTDYIADGRIVGVDVLPLQDGSLVELRPWDGESRFTLVVGGLDRRPEETGLAHRTDSLMILSIDPNSSSIGILSIPRDLLVSVPGYAKRQKINTVLPNGEGQRYGFGPTLLQQTVQYNFGIPVHNYVLMDFQALIDIVDIIDGIEITIDYTLDDPKYPDMNYGYDPLFIPAGTHKLNGYNALRFARTRHGNNDMRRAERQQLVLYAIRDRILSFDMVPRLILQAPQLWATLSDNLYTGLELGQVIQLALFVKDIDLANITTGVMNYNYVEDYTTEDGLFALIPSQGQVGYLMRNVFGDNYSQ